MASSGSFLTNGWYSSKGDYVYLEFAWYVQSISNEDNSTTIHWELRGKRTASGYVMAGAFEVIVDDRVLYKTSSTDNRIELYNGTVVASGTYTIYHDLVGRATLHAAVSGAIYTYQASYSGSGSWELPLIPHYATLTSATDFTDEENPTIRFVDPAPRGVTLYACISLDGSKDDIKYRKVSTTHQFYTFNLTEEERNVLRNATASSNSRSVMFILRTVVDDDASLASNSFLWQTLSIVNANPIFTDDKVSYADVSQSVVATTGNNQHIVQNQSSLTATFGAATGNKGASITGYTLKLNGVTKTKSTSGSVSFGQVNSSQDVTLSITAKDSRGNTTTVNKNVKVLPWSLPVFSASVERLNNYEDETYLTVNASISSVNSKNTMAISYQYKKNGGSFGSAKEISNRTKQTINCDKNYAYVFRITVADKFGNTTKDFLLDKGKFPLFIDTESNAVGINEFPSDGEALRVAGGLACFDDGIVLKSANYAFKITISDSGTLTATKLE